MMWKRDPNVEEARQHPSWVAFHRACGENNLFFDHMEWEGGKRNGAYHCDAYTTSPSKAGGRNSHHIVTGKGKTVIESVIDAYQKSGRTTEKADRIAEGFYDDFEGLLG